MRNLILSLACLLTSACYYSEDPLIAGEERKIIRSDSIFSLSIYIFYLNGSGNKVAVCLLDTKSDFPPNCRGGQNISIKRTIGGNYVVQYPSKTVSGIRYHYGIWYRTDKTNEGKAGYQCFEWLGEKIVGGANLIPLWLADTEFGKSARDIASFERISKGELDKLINLYEMHFLVDQKCYGNRLKVNQSSIVIQGDNRHLPDYE